MIKNKIQLDIIPEPKEGTATVLVFDIFNPGTLNPYAGFSGSGNTDYICGGCRVVLGEGIDRGQIKGMVLRCPKCKGYNELRGH